MKSFKSNSIIIIVSAIIFMLIWSCSPKNFPDSHFAACYPNHPYDTVTFQWTDPPDSLLRLLSKRYTKYSLMVANSAGLLFPLYEYELQKKKLQNDNSALQQLALLEQREKILNRINLFRVEVGSVAAELDCEGERADQLSTYLDKLDRIRTKNFTVASIVLGAATGIATSLVQNDDAKAVAVIGGIGTAVLGLLSLSSNQKVNFQHPRNLLSEIWFIPVQSRYYPTMVWNMLSHTMFSNSGEFSVAYYSRKSWQTYWSLQQGDKKADKKIKLLMGKGGQYSASELKLRANMINQLQAAVKLIDQDIQGLVTEIIIEK